MKYKETGKEKVQQICDLLKKETLEPAHEEAKKIIKQAQAHADQIIEGAKSESDQIFKAMKADMEKEKRVFDAAMNLACKQAITSLKQEIEHRIFNEALLTEVRGAASKPELIAQIIQSICEGIAKEGIEGRLQAFVPNTTSPKDIASQLASQIVEKIGKEGISLGDFAGGAQVKIVEKNLILDMSDKALRKFLADFIREDLRELIFKAT